MKSNRLLIITPTFNEAENLAAFIEGVFENAPEANVLVVDDNSPDGTGVLADDFARKDSRIHVLHREGKQGLGSAYVTGFSWALEKEYEVIFEMDADLSHDPKSIAEMCSEIEQGADLVIGSRNIPGGRIDGWGPIRHLVSKGGSFYSRMILGLPVRDLTSGYKAFRASTLREIEYASLVAEGYAFQIEATYRAAKIKKRIVECPIVFVDRRAGQSKMSLGIVLEAVWVVWKFRFRGFPSKR